MDTATKILLVGCGDASQAEQCGHISAASPMWEVFSCSSGRAALEAYEELQPTCLLLDFRLPDMDGLACVKSIRRKSGKNVPVLMLMARNDEDAVGAAMQYGIQDYLFKDVRGNYLTLLPALLQKILREQRSIKAREGAEAALVQLARKFEHLFLGVTDGIILADERGQIETINPAACRIFGYPRDEICGKPLKAIMGPADKSPASIAFVRFLHESEGPFVGRGAKEVLGMRKDGQAFPLELAITEITFDSRRMFAGVMRDVSERHRLQEAALESDARFRGAFDNAPIGMALVSLDGRWLKVNAALCDIVGHTESDMLSGSFQDITHPDDLVIDQTFVQLVLQDQLKTYQMETRYFHKDGHAVPVMLSSSLVRDADEKPLYFITKIEDITQRKKMEDALFAEKDLAQTTLQSIGDAVISTDAQGLVTYMNPIAERLTGWPAGAACGKAFDQVFVIIQEGTRLPVPSPILQALADGKISNLANDTLLIARDGMEYFIDNSAAPIRLRDGRLTGVVMVFHDVTDARNLSRKISHQASHDALTGLHNRSEFELTAARLLQSANVSQGPHAMLFLDLDQFKIVNDTCGHLAGDHLLRQLAATLLSHTRKSDLLARLGGDEFGILLEGCPQERALGIAQNLVDTVRAFRFEWEGKLFGVGVSIGLVVLDAASKDLETVLRCADQACYEAKEKGRNRVQLYNAAAAISSAPALAPARIDWPERLRDAVLLDHFSMYYQRVQPIAGQDASCHYEVLLRYPEKHGRLLLPMAFIPAAERHGLLPSIDRWVIEQLLTTPPCGLLEPDPGAYLTINLSSASLADPQFREFVLRAVQEGAIPAHRLCFEISEATAITHLQNTTQFAAALRQLGARISLDDFGGGLSSFSYLKGLQVDYLKIDGAIVKGITGDAVDAAMVESINRIARVMGISSIAKCVENDAILQRLVSIGIDYGQGYALHMPEPILG